MKNRMEDVRNHLVARLEELGDPEASAQAVERAKATALLASQYITAIKVEIDARRLLLDTNIGLPPALEAPHEAPPLRAIGGKRA